MHLTFFEIPAHCCVHHSPGRSLLVKIKTAIPERIAHRLALQELETVLPAAEMETWKEEVESWEKDPYAHENPFAPRVNRMSFNTNYHRTATLINSTSAPTQADIRLALATEESLSLDTADENTIRSEISPSAMITMGLELEELQYVSSLHAL